MAAELVVGGGRLIFVPPVVRPDPRKEAGVLLDCVQGLLGTPLDSQPPDWIEDYRLPGQTELEERLSKTEESWQVIRAKLDAAAGEMNSWRGFRGLL